MRCRPQCVQLDCISAHQQNHTVIWAFLTAGFRIPVLLSSLQRNALWHLFHFLGGGEACCFFFVCFLGKKDVLKSRS